jgi:hypothetical protein
MAGLDPAIHASGQNFRENRGDACPRTIDVDGRVEPGHYGWWGKRPLGDRVPFSGA